MVSQSCLDSSLQENWSIAFAVRHPIPILVLICGLRMCQHAETTNWKKQLHPRSGIEKQLHVKQMTYTQSLDVSLFCAVVRGKINITSSQPVAVPRSVPQSCIIRNNSLCTKAWTLFENSFVPPNKIVPKGKPTAPKICCAICSNEVEKDQVAMCVECKKNKFDVCTEIEAHLILHPPFLPIRFSYKYGGGLII